MLQLKTSRKPGISGIANTKKSPHGSTASLLLGAKVRSKSGLAPCPLRLDIGHHAFSAMPQQNQCRCFASRLQMGMQASWVISGACPPRDQMDKILHPPWYAPVCAHASLPFAMTLLKVTLHKWCIYPARLSTMSASQCQALPGRDTVNPAPGLA